MAQPIILCKPNKNYHIIESVHNIDPSDNRYLYGIEHNNLFHFIKNIDHKKLYLCDHNCCDTVTIDLLPGKLFYERICPDTTAYAFCVPYNETDNKYYFCSAQYSFRQNKLEYKSDDIQFRVKTKNIIVCLYDKKLTKEEYDLAKNDMRDYPVGHSTYFPKLPIESFILQFKTEKYDSTVSYNFDYWNQIIPNLQSNTIRWLDADPNEKLSDQIEITLGDDTFDFNPAFIAKWIDWPNPFFMEFDQIFLDEYDVETFGTMIRILLAENTTQLDAIISLEYLDRPDILLKVRNLAIELSLYAVTGLMTDICAILDLI